MTSSAVRSAVRADEVVPAQAPSPADRRRSAIACGIPVFNPDERLARALDSIAAQSLPPVVVHLRDDASTNGFDVASLTQQWAGEGLRLSRNPANVGMFDNFLRLAVEAEGEFFCFLAQDDQWLPGYLEKLHDALVQQPGAVVAFSSNQHLVDGEVVDTYATPSAGIVLHRPLSLLVEFFRGNTRLNNAIYYGLWRRDVLVDVLQHIQRRGLRTNEKLPVMLGILSGPAVSVPDMLFVKDHGRRRNSRGPGGDVGPLRYVFVLLPQLVTGITCVMTFGRASLWLRLAAVLGQVWMFARKVCSRLLRAIIPMRRPAG